MRQIELIHKDNIKPYENNPRNNTQAVSKVAESIRLVIVDMDNAIKDGKQLSQ